MAPYLYNICLKESFEFEIFCSLEDFNRVYAISVRYNYGQVVTEAKIKRFRPNFQFSMLLHRPHSMLRVIFVQKVANRPIFQSSSGLMD